MSVHKAKNRCFLNRTKKHHCMNAKNSKKQNRKEFEKVWGENQI